MTPEYQSINGDACDASLLAGKFSKAAERIIAFRNECRDMTTREDWRSVPPEVQAVYADAVEALGAAIGKAVKGRQDALGRLAEFRIELARLAREYLEKTEV